MLNPTLLVDEWHPTKNGSLRPENFKSYSNKKVWWQCLKNKKHVWAATINHRSRGKGSKCSYCTRRKYDSTNSLLALHPELAAQWHPSKTSSLKPEIFWDFKKPVWWKCPKGADHEWDATVYNRKRTGKCPFCSNKRVSETNCLSTTDPELADQWHTTKNKGLSPEDVTAGSNKQVWWKCAKGHDPWKARVSNRKKNNCPQCFAYFSRPEAQLLEKLRDMYGKDKVLSRYRIKGREADIYLPDFGVTIEYDGWYWHQDSFEKDCEKRKFFIKQGLFPINVREKPLRPVSNRDIFVENSGRIKDGKNITKAVIDKTKIFMRGLCDANY